MVDKTYVVDSAFSGGTRTDGRKLNISIVELNNNMMISQIPLTVSNPSQSDIDTWVPGATVTGTFAVTAPPPSATGASGATGTSGTTGASGTSGATGP